LGILLLGDYLIIRSPGWILKTLVGIALIASLFIPYIRRFTKPALPIFGWLITFYACQFIPNEYRPRHIFVNILPTLERVLYGASLSEIISKHTHPALDILAWLPYGVIHFSFPFILSFLLFLYGPPRSANVFGQAFGYMNIAGVLTQLLFPNASPCKWKKKSGFKIGFGVGCILNAFFFSSLLFSSFSTLRVRNDLWIFTGRLFYTRRTWRTSTNRRYPRAETLWINIWWIPLGVWCLPISALRFRNDRNAICHIPLS
jgi:TRAP-type C4-dicarboxylate transport system permease small subunit